MSDKLEERLVNKAQRAWFNMMRIALKYPKNVKRDRFKKWSNACTKINKKRKKNSAPL